MHDRPVDAIDERIGALAAEIAAHRRGRVPSALRRAHLLALATRAFVDAPYAEVSMDELAAAAGVSKPVVYDLAGSKEQLFADVMAASADELADRVASAVRGEADTSQHLFVGAVAFFDFVAERRRAWSMLLAVGGGPVSDGVAAMRRRQADQVTSLLLESAGSAGVAVDPLWVEGAAHAINGAFESLTWWWQEHPELRAEDLAALLTALVEPGLTSLAPNRP